MALVTYTFSPGERIAPQAKGRTGESVFSRLFARFLDYRRQQAARELARHGLRLPSELELAGWQLNERNEDSLPFVR